MASRTPALAVAAFTSPLQRALSCISDAVLDVGGGYHPAGEPHAATLAGGLPVPLGRGDWTVQISAYSYRLVDQLGSELLAYHWHPFGRSSLTSPHLHLGPVGVATRSALLGAHLPTGRIALDDVTTSRSPI